MRVRLDLFYRDGSNYKLADSTTFSGRASLRDVLRLQDSLVADMGMVPTAVGLPCLSFSSGRSTDDHPWHEVTGVAEEPGEPEDPRSFTAFVDECVAADWNAAAIAWACRTPSASRPRSNPRRRTRRRTR